jgi:hypothetical protein
MLTCFLLVSFSQFCDLIMVPMWVQKEHSVHMYRYQYHIYKYK